MAEGLSGRCEFEGDCPTLKYLQEQTRKLKKESTHLYEIMIDTHDRLGNDYCHFGQSRQCRTYKELSKGERAKITPEVPQKIEASEGVKIVISKGEGK